MLDILATVELIQGKAWLKAAEEGSANKNSFSWATNGNVRRMFKPKKIGS